MTRLIPRATCLLAVGLAMACPAFGADHELPINSVSVGDDGRLRFEVPSTEEHYYVLIRQDGLDGNAAGQPVSIHLGEPRSTVLSEPLGAGGAAGFYRVREHLRSAPADSDGDGIDDLTELAGMADGRLAPLNASPEIPPLHGTVSIPDRQTFRDLSYQGQSVAIDYHLEDLEFVKFYILDSQSANPTVYFMNTNKHRAHLSFAAAVNLPGGGFESNGGMRGEIVYHPYLAGPGGEPGLYRFEFEPEDSYSFERVRKVHELLAANMPFLRNNLAYYPMPAAALPRYHEQKPLFDASRIPILLEEDLFGDIAFLPLNIAEGYGLLRLMDPSERPGPRDITIYESLPNELPRVGGVITTVPQTPLSHVNLRAVQDGVPNAFIAGALDVGAISSLIGKYVYFRVSADGYEIREASSAEVDAHYEAIRPIAPQEPARNLEVTSFLSLDDVSFADADAFGVKAANLATLHTLGFPEETIPEGFALPFHFYHEYMKFNGFYDELADLLADPDFRGNIDERDRMLEDFREKIELGMMPLWMVNALTELQYSFPVGTSIRCRSSTNNEDLPGFSGAGLYDSFTHHPHEHHLQKTIKQVFASLWNFRAFEEREFYRIDHFSTAMGVLIHPNFRDEQANGVAVTTDPLYQTSDTYYLNTQVGEDLVTNPEAASTPEEILINRDESSDFTVVRTSNQLPDDETILSPAHLAELHGMLQAIEGHFRVLYGVAVGENFAMEVEFKLTADGRLSIKQARPWVY